MEAMSKAVSTGFRDLNRLRKATALNLLRAGRISRPCKQTSRAQVAATPQDKLKKSEQALARASAWPRPIPGTNTSRPTSRTSSTPSPWLQLDLGNFTEARRHLDQALALREALVKDKPKNLRCRPTWPGPASCAVTFPGRLAGWPRRPGCGRKNSVSWRPWNAGNEPSGHFWATPGHAAEPWPNITPAPGCGPKPRSITSGSSPCPGRRIWTISMPPAWHCGSATPPRISACEGMIKRWGDEANIDRDIRLAQACSLADNARMDLSQLLKWARKRASKNNSINYWRDHVQGLVHYRAGQFSEAITLSSQSHNFGTNWSGSPLSWPVLAMAHHRLGNAAVARLWLEKSTREWRRLSPLMHKPSSATVLPAPATIWQTRWHDWPIFEILLREASVLITGKPPVEEGYDHAHRSLMYSRLDESEKAECPVEGGAGDASPRSDDLVGPRPPVRQVKAPPGGRDGSCQERRISICHSGGVERTRGTLFPVWANRQGDG